MAKRSASSSRKTSSTKAAPKARPTAAAVTARSPRAPRRPAARPRPTAEQIAIRAYELFEARGGTAGDPTADWLQAEQELSAPPVRRASRAKTKTA